MQPTAKLLALAMVAAWTLAAAADEPTHEFFTTSDGVKIHYMRLGQSGTPVVLVHGYTGSAEESTVKTTSNCGASRRFMSM